MIQLWYYKQHLDYQRIVELQTTCASLMRYRQHKRREIIELHFTQLPSREDEIKQAFNEFIAQHPHFTATQVNFVRTIRSAILHRARLTADDLQRPPFSRIGAVHNLFNEAELT